MARARSAFSELLGTILGCLIAIAAYDGFTHTFGFLPALDNMISPIVAIQAAYDQRDEDRACFYLDIHKLAKGRPLTYKFFGQTRIAANAEWGPPLSLSA